MLKDKLSACEAQKDVLLNSRDAELSELRKALTDSVNRTRELEKLNEEGYTLMMMTSAKASGLMDIEA